MTVNWLSLVTVLTVILAPSKIGAVPQCVRGSRRAEMFTERQGLVLVGGPQSAPIDAVRRRGEAPIRFGEIHRLHQS